MKNTLIVILAVICTWLVAEWIPSPRELFNNDLIDVEMASAIVLEDHPAEMEDIEEMAESDIYKLINKERVNIGLIPLSWSNHLDAKAKEHSLYMSGSGNFAHSNINRYENLYYSRHGGDIKELPLDVLNSWLNSPNHKTNLLSGQILHCGIGVISRAHEVFVTFIAE